MSSNMLPHTLEEFLLQLYHCRLITVDEQWVIPRKLLCDEYAKYISNNKNHLRRSINIEDLLKCENLILPSSSIANVEINAEKLLNYRATKLDEYNKERMTLQLDLPPGVKIVFEIDNSLPSIGLVYRGSRHDNRISFKPKDFSCYICQRNYPNLDNFEDHVNTHNGESNFAALNYFRELESSVFKLSYKICSKTRNYRYIIQTNAGNIVIEKIILIMSNIMFYIDDSKVPYALAPGEIHTFDLSRYLFNMFVEQAIVIVFHQKGSEQIRHLEQHHYMPCEKIPKTMANPSDLYLPQLSSRLFQKTESLDLYIPTLEFRRAIEDNKNRIKKLKALSREFTDYWERNKMFTLGNYCGALKLLLEVEDFSTVQAYVKLEEHNVTLRPGKIFSWYIGHFVEDILAPLDEVIIVEEPNENSEESNKVDDWRIYQLNVNDQRKENGSKPTRFYVGVVKKFYKGRVVFRCADFKPQSNKKYTLMFRPIRFVIRYQYRALELLQKMDCNFLKQYFFPDLKTEDCSNEITKGLSKMHLSSGNLPLDREQSEAVESIVNDGVGNVAPYVIIGPPGSGKTTTIVTAITQLYQKNKNNRILVMASSNFACDEIAVRLIQALGQPSRDAKAIVRLYARSFGDQINEAYTLLLNYSNMQKSHFFPCVAILHEYHVVVCTLSVAAKLSLGNFGRGVFTHVFVDEAPSSTETEILMGIMCTLNSNTKLILSGDTKQLGTRLHSQRAEIYGLGVSLMQRLLQRDCYKINKDGIYNHNVMICLKRNYRAHPEIVGIYNELYYDNQLISKANIDEVSLGCRWHKTPNSSFPIIYHNVHGKELRKDYSRSTFNPLEVQIILDYIADLLLFGINGQPINENDIGIITPYNAQHTLIKDSVFRRKWFNIKCGVTENFQGMEKQIIFVSFVRTKNIGFLKQRERVNTIISRAKSLLILVGDARNLSKNDDMKYIIDKCQANNSLIGEKYTKQDEPVIDKKIEK